MVNRRLFIHAFIIAELYEYKQSDAAIGSGWAVVIQTKESLTSMKVWSD